MRDDWPFCDPKDVAVITLKRIVFEAAPILHVTHDADDGGWQFLGDETPAVEDGAVVALETIVKLDPTVRELADLPLGWEARRPSAGQRWKREPKHE